MQTALTVPCPRLSFCQDVTKPWEDFEAPPGLLLLDGLHVICNEDLYADYEKSAKADGYGCGFLRMARAMLLLLMDVLGVGRERKSSGWGWCRPRIKRMVLLPEAGLCS